MVTLMCTMGEKFGSSETTPPFGNPFCLNMQPAPGGKEAGREQLRRIKPFSPPTELTWKSIVGAAVPGTATELESPKDAPPYGLNAAKTRQKSRAGRAHDVQEEESSREERSRTHAESGTRDVAWVASVRAA